MNVDAIALLSEFTKPKPESAAALEHPDSPPRRIFIFPPPVILCLSCKMRHLIPRRVPLYTGGRLILFLFSQTPLKGTLLFVSS